MVKKTSRFRFLLHGHYLIKTIFNKITKYRVKDTNLNRFFNYSFDYEHPRTFNEWTIWLKHNYQNDLWNKCADKLGSKDFLMENGLEQYVVKTLGVYSTTKEINLDELPNRFVLKANHDCGSVFICEKGKTNFKEVFTKLDFALKHAYYEGNNEWVYSKIKPVIFAEEILIPNQSNQLIDYKLFGFNGTFGWGYTGQDRNTDTRFAIFENDFAIQPVEYVYLKPRKTNLPPKPIHYNEMIEICKMLSKKLGYVRVDFYETTKGLKIGELTFFSHSGYGRFSKQSYDFKYGAFFKKVDFSKR